MSDISFDQLPLTRDERDKVLALAVSDVSQLHGMLHAAHSQFVSYLGIDATSRLEKFLDPLFDTPENSGPGSAIPIYRLGVPISAVPAEDTSRDGSLLKNRDALYSQWQQLLRTPGAEARASELEVQLNQLLESISSQRR